MEYSIFLNHCYSWNNRTVNQSLKKLQGVPWICVIMFHFAHRDERPIFSRVILCSIINLYCLFLSTTEKQSLKGQGNWYTAVIFYKLFFWGKLVSNDKVKSFIFFVVYDEFGCYYCLKELYINGLYFSLCN